MASLRRKGKVYYVRFRTDDGRQTERKVGPDKSVALKIKRDLETKLVNVKLGLETSQADGERIPISQHVESYVANLEARGHVLEHTRLVRQRLEWFLAETKITRLSQLRPALADQALSTLRKAALLDLGERKLKDLDRPVRLFQLTAPGPDPRPPRAAAQPAARAARQTRWPLRPGRCRGSCPSVWGFSWPVRGS